MSPDAAPGTPRGPWWRRGPGIAGLVGVVALLAAVTWWAVTSGEPSDTRATPSGGTNAPTSATSVPSTSQTPAPTTAPSTEVTGTPDAAAPTATVPAEPEQPVVTAGIAESGAPREGVEVRVDRVQSVTGEARGIGEIAGPAVRVTVAIDNQSGRALSLTDALVTVTYGRDDAPAGDLSGPGTRPFPARVASGDTARGTYVFSVPRDERRRLAVRFSYDSAAPAVVFSGPASGARS